MPLNPNALTALAYGPVETPDPQEVALRQQQFANMRNAGQLQQQQLQTGQLQQTALGQENQMRQIQLDDQKKLQQAFLDVYGPSSSSGSGSGSSSAARANASGSTPAGNGGAGAAPSTGGTSQDPFSRVLDRAQQLGVSYNGLQGLLQQHLQMQEGYAKLSKAQTDAALALHTQVQSALEPVLKITDPQQQAAAWEGVRQKLIAQGGQLGQIAEQNPYPGSPQAAGLMVAGLNYEKHTLTNSQQTTADLHEAEIPGKKADSQIAQYKAELQKQAIDAFNANPQAGGRIIDSVLPANLDQTANASYKAAWQSAMQTGGPDAALHIIEAAAAHAAEISRATNPNIIQADVNKAVATEKATAPIKVAEQVQSEIQKARLAPGEFSSVIDPTARQRAMADYTKSTNDYLDKMGAAQQFQNFIQAAQSGNKAAPGLLGITELRQLVNRINRQELEAVTSSAGSALDRVQGFVNKYTEGQPIPPAVLKDMASVSRVMSMAAQTTYNNKVAMNRKMYGSKASPMQFDPGAAGGGNYPEVTTQAQYDKLPSGSIYRENGALFKKP